ncbi:MAG: hypothetical protein IPO09_20075 [Anaeromyxobacter sp.]|nr:hypothetical protein [Anaeromyxobacter sp.]MBL0274912.1 hypothetical protein [Anaeromyxobacter sp.]
MWQTCALLIALATAAPPAGLAPLPGEPPRAFLCRATHLPAGRACSSRCDQAGAVADPAGPAHADAGWACRLSCTHRALHAMADCRARPAAPATSPLAAR